MGRAYHPDRKCWDAGRDYVGPGMLWNYGRKVLHVHTLIVLELWKKACKLSSDHNNLNPFPTVSTGLYDAAKEAAEADAGVGGKNGRSGQADSSQSDGSEQADVERVERYRRNGR